MDKTRKKDSLLEWVKAFKSLIQKTQKAELHKGNMYSKLSTTFQLYRGDQYPEKTTDLPQVTIFWTYLSC